MNREPVASKACKSIGYDPKSKVLQVEYTGGAVNEYENVPPELHKKLMKSDSIGQFLAKNIVPGNFKFFNKGSDKK
jgi:hypothetical protein